MTHMKFMNSESMNLDISVLFRLACGLLLAFLISFALSAAPHPAGKTASQAKPRTFETPGQAAEALVQATEKYDVPALEEIFGPDGHDLILTGEPARDKEMAEGFAAEAREKMKVSLDPNNKKRAILYVGLEDWPLPVPIVQSGGKWSFDAKAGRKDLLFRRIG